VGDRCVRTSRTLLDRGHAPPAAEAGFAVTTRVGEPFQLVRGELTVEPFSEVQRPIAGETSSDAWRTRWTELGLADRTLDEPRKPAG
jgi:hypothetical protein